MTIVTAHAAGMPCWVDLMTPDDQKARDFYAEVLGWEFDVGPPESGPYSMCTLKGQPVAGMGPLPPDAPFPTAWTVYFASDDVDASAAKVQALGGSVAIGPMDVFEEGRMLVAADPTGAMFGLWQPRRHRGAGVIGEPGAFAWCEVNTRDADKARDFYAGLLGFQPKPLEMPETAYYTLERDGQAHAGVMQMNEKWPADLPAHWMAYFAVDDTDDAVVRVDAAGGKLHVPPFDTPYGRMAVVADPAGAAFSIIQLTEPG